MFIAGLSKAISDKLVHHYTKSIFTRFNPNFWNPSISHNNKYKGGLKENGEKFFLSTTALVMFTDAWHLFNFVGNSCLIFSTVLALKSGFLYYCSWYYVVIYFVVFKSVFTGSFNLFYSKVFIIKKKKR